MNPSHRWTLLGSLSFVAAVGLGAAGCQRDTPPAPAADKPVEVSKPVVEAPKPETKDGEKKDGERKDGERPEIRGLRGGPVGSPEMLLATALRELTLTDAQKTAIQAAADSLHGERGERGGDDHDGDPAGRKALAAGVRAGKVDPKAAVQAPTEDPKAVERRTKGAAALKTLHATLTPEQRKTLVDSATKRADAVVAPNDAPEAGAHGARVAAMGAMRGVRGSRVMRLTRDLELTDEQKKSMEKAIEGVMPKEDREAHKAQAEAARTAMKTRLAAFATDTFDAAAYVKAQADEAAKGRPAPGAQLASELSVVVPLLTPEQRTKLAAKLEK